MKEKSGARGREGREAGEMQEKEGTLAKREGTERKEGKKRLMFCKTCKMLVKVLKNKDFYRFVVGVLCSIENNLMHNTRSLPQNSPNFQTF